MRRFRAILAQENTETREGWLTRRFPAGAFEWIDSEGPWQLQVSLNNNHADVFPLGAIEVLQREGDYIVGAGFLDDEGVGDLGDQARHAIHLIEVGVLNGVSVIPGNGGLDVDEACTHEDEDGWCDQVTVTFARYSIGAATVLATPGLQGTLIELLDADPDDDRQAALEAVGASADAEAVVAAVAARSVLGPAEWFADPQLDTLTRVPQVTEDGRVFGHIAGWEDCHLSFPMQAGSCQAPWRSACAYARFHVCSQVVGGPDGPEPMMVGPLAVSGGHFPTDGDNARNWRGAQAHYDDPATVTAYCRVGEDEHGIWFAGAISPIATAEQIDAFRAHPLSGDWRRIDGNMELVGACSVVVPGFISRVAVAASAEPVAAVVAGGPLREPATCGCGGSHAEVAAAPLTFALPPSVEARLAAMQRDINMLRQYAEPGIREAARARMRAIH